MCDYHIWADTLNKFSQLTPWVQALVVLALPLTVCALGYVLRLPRRPRWPMEAD